MPGYAIHERRKMAGHSIAAAQITFVANGVHPNTFYNYPESDRVEWKKFGILLTFTDDQQMWLHAQYNCYDEQAARVGLETQGAPESLAARVARAYNL